MNSSRPVGLLLAAGRSTRFGADKLLQSLPDGTPVGLASARNLRQGVDHVLAVVPPDDDALRRLLAADGIATVVCANAADGMAASLACGVRASADAGGWLIALADMPLIRPPTIAAVAAAIAAGAAIAAPFHGGRRGHPVGFAARFGAALAGLTGDHGARPLLAANAALVERIDCDDPGILADIDVPADLPRRG